MSAAHVALAETPRLAESSVAFDSVEERLRDLVHELRQPLSSIEAIAYYVEMTLPPGQLDARLYMAQLQQLVADANRVLERAARPARKPAMRATTAGVS
jgi:signal transduction histidine kinase